MAQRLKSSKSAKKSSKSSSVRRKPALTVAFGAVEGVLSHAKTSAPHRARRKRRASQRANSAATQALYAEAEISTAPVRERVSVLKQSAAHLDDVELETAWRAALRGDYVTASDRLNRTIKRGRVQPRKRKPRGWTPWRNALLPRRK